MRAATEKQSVSSSEMRAVMVERYDAKVASLRASLEVAEAGQRSACREKTVEVEIVNKRLREVEAQVSQGRIRELLLRSGSEEAREAVVPYVEREGMGEAEREQREAARKGEEGEDVFFDCREDFLV